MIEFNEFPKMARLSREIIVSEKVDGTNSSIYILQGCLETPGEPQPHVIASVVHNGITYTIRAGSRNRWITPGKLTDNAGFARWAQDNAYELVKLGEGHHFGEWWGQGIQRGYNLKEKRFSLFNIERWGSDDIRPKCCHVIPELYKGSFDTAVIDEVLTNLKDSGSFASPGFMKPEGIVVWHTAANIDFKKTIEKDEIPKSL